VEVKLGEKGAELSKVELAYVGLYRSTGDVPEEVLIVNYVSMLFPFARREIADVISGGGFQPVMLDPIDFKTMYLQQGSKVNRK
jgi:preprotein translocase subunit SecB